MFEMEIVGSFAAPVNEKGMTNFVLPFGFQFYVNASGINFQPDKQYKVKFEMSIYNTCRQQFVVTSFLPRKVKSLSAL